MSIEDDFKLLTNVVAHIIWTDDENGNAEYFNKKWYNYTGLTNEQSVGLGWKAVVHPDDTSAVDEWHKAFAEKQIFQKEVRIRRYDGEFEWHLLLIEPFITSNGQVDRWFGTATNIQANKHLEQSNRKMATFLKAVLDSAVDFAIISLDPQGYVVNWSSGAEKMFGYNENEVIGKYTDIIFTEDDRMGGIPEKELNEAREKGFASDERWHIRKDGTRFFMSGVMTPMNDGSGFVKITRNITDRKLGEEALLMAEHRNSIAMHSAMMGEWKWNLAEDEIYINNITAQILELPHETEKIAASLFLNMIHSDDVQPLRDELSKALSGLGILQCEVRISAKGSESYKWINFYGRIIQHENDKPKLMLGVMYDISERKFLERQKDDFLSIASHELKTPVTSIKAYTEVLLDIFETSGDKGNAELVSKLNGQVDRLIQLFNVLLDSTRVTEGRLHIAPHTFDLNKVLEEQVAEFRLMYPSRTLHLERSEIALVHADEAKIRQVIANLLSNAVKYSREDTDVYVSSEDGQDGAIVKVRDFGAGIDVEEQQKIFKQYYRGNAKNVMSQSGFGLGLFICAEIIRQHHGLIGVDSTPGEGSTFYFKLQYA